MPDGPDLNEIGVLRRREIEARVLGPMLAAFAEAYGREPVLAIAARVIREIAETQGRELAERLGARDLRAFAGAKEPWTRGGSLEIRVLRETESEYAFDVTRCRYAEMYRALGVPELGAILSCGRDFALGRGFNPALELRRTQTIMEGAPHCDFRYRLDPARPPDPPAGADAPARSTPPDRAAGPPAPSGG